MLLEVLPTAQQEQSSRTQVNAVLSEPTHFNWFEHIFNSNSLYVPTSAAMTTPIGPKIPGVRLDMSACKSMCLLHIFSCSCCCLPNVTSMKTCLPFFLGGNPRATIDSEELSDQQQHKRPRNVDESVAVLTSHILQFAQQTKHAISDLFIDLPNDGSTTVFGQRTPELPGRKYVFRPGFQTDPWIRGVVPYPPQSSVSYLIEEFFAKAPPEELSRCPV